MWLTRSQGSIDGVVAAREGIAAAAARQDVAATGAACQAATGAVADLHRQLPSPEQTLNSTLQYALGSYEIGLPYCVSGAKTYDAEALMRAAAYITRGDIFMRMALDITGREPSPPDVVSLIV
ncbi:MAG: hypothetical protein JOZ00_03065 [Mycobacterium sp.]|uniref:hypothetical protein n=1 Tax=Mycobacterium sp. TaxID=1785 RepID=UPI001EB4E661|nr:hypothetical protein [Mycobacterium sp.]MBV8785649.1 hypothetical protein [Mycobacterium sp.]